MTEPAVKVQHVFYVNIGNGHGFGVVAEDEDAVRDQVKKNYPHSQGQRVVVQAAATRGLRR